MKKHIVSLSLLVLAIICCSCSWTATKYQWRALSPNDRNYIDKKSIAYSFVTCYPKCKIIDSITIPVVIDTYFYTIGVFYLPIIPVFDGHLKGDLRFAFYMDSLNELKFNPSKVKYYSDNIEVKPLKEYMKDTIITYSFVKQNNLIDKRRFFWRAKFEDTFSNLDSLTVVFAKDAFEGEKEFSIKLKRQGKFEYMGYEPNWAH